MTTPIAKIEGDIDTDIDKDHLNPFSMLLLQDGQDKDANHAPQQQQQQVYFLQSINSNIVIRQLPSQGLSFQLWPAAAILITLLDNIRGESTPLSDLFKRQEKEDSPLRILELGSGTGVVGIAAAAILGAKITVTDLPHVLPNIQFNVDANSKVLEQQSGVVDVAALNWGESQDVEAVGRDYDLILGSDVVYHDHLYDPLIKTLKFLLGGEKKIAFVMAHLRRWKKESVFFKRAKKLFDVQIIHTEPPSNGSRIGVVVYLFTGKDSLKRATVVNQIHGEKIASREPLSSTNA